MFTYLANISTSIADSWRKCKESLATAAKAGGSNLTSKSPSTLLVNRPITWLWAASKRSFFTAYEDKTLKNSWTELKFIKNYVLLWRRFPLEAKKSRLAFNTSLFTRIYAMKSAVANFYVSVGAALLDNNYEKNQNVLYSTNANKWYKIMELVFV